MPTKRRPVNKTFSGCARCKASKVKCDETKPSCNRCVARRLTCPGYPLGVVRWSTKHEVYNPPGADPALPTSSSSSTFVNRLVCLDSAPTKISPKSPPDRHTATSPRTTETHASQTQGASNASIKPNVAVDLTSTSNSTSRLPAQTAVASQPYRKCAPINHAMQRKTFIRAPIDNLPQNLIDYYFRDVCSVFSSYDSDLNPFRSYVSQVYSSSAPVYHAMLSSSAARMADKDPKLNIVGLQYQSQALRCIAESLKQGNEMPQDTLFAIFIVGLSTAWHDGRDIGLAHFRAAQRAITSDLISKRGTNPSIINFFKFALTYWEMALSLVSDDVELASGIEKESDKSSNGNKRILPHPWTGVSTSIQIIFSRVAKVMRSLRFVQSPSEWDIARYQKLSEDAENLEVAMLTSELPDLSDVQDSGDVNTPPLHHVLLAEAYIFGGLYQIYRKFPDILERRRQHTSGFSWSQTYAKNNPITDWYSSLPKDATDDTLLRSLGINVLNRLQKIEITSGTRSVQGILICVAAGSLEMPSPFTLESNLLDDQAVPAEKALESESKCVAELREFTISRLSSLRKLIHSRPVDLMLQVVKEMFRRLDAGEEVFWLDVIHDLNCETMLG